jgi:hypothetical protein
MARNDIEPSRARLQACDLRLWELAGGLEPQPAVYKTAGIRPPGAARCGPCTHGVGPCQGRERVGPPAGPWVGWLVVLVVRAESWDGEGPDDVAELAPMPPLGPRGWVRMTVESGPGLLSQLNGCVAGACKDASAPGLAFSDDWGGTCGWGRLWKQRASSRRAMATVAMLAPRRWVSWPRCRPTVDGAWPSGRPPAGSSAPTASPAW